MLTCTWLNPFIRCTDSAICTITYGCVHEHIATDPTCQFHLTQVDSIFASIKTAFCGPCNIADGHKCKMKLISTDKLVEHELQGGSNHAK